MTSTRYVLLGSSQIQLIEQIRVSLAGQVSLLELYPLTLPKRLMSSWAETIQPSRLMRLLADEGLPCCRTFRKQIWQPARTLTLCADTKIFGSHQRAVC